MLHPTGCTGVQLCLFTTHVTDTLGTRTAFAQLKTFIVIDREGRANLQLLDGDELHHGHDAKECHSDQFAVWACRVNEVLQADSISQRRERRFDLCIIGILFLSSP